jgi:hypothetical protein
MQRLWKAFALGVALFLCSSAHSQSASYPILNSTIVNSDLYTGSDVCARIHSADTALGTAPADITVNVAGTCSSALTLASGHNLIFTAPVTISTAPILSGNNKVSCSGPDALITSGVTAGTGIFETATGADSIDFGAGCSFYSSAGFSAWMLEATNHITNLHLHHVSGTNVSVYFGHPADAIASKNLLIDNFSVNYPAGASNYNAAAIYITTSWDGVNIDHGYISGGNHGVEFFGIDSVTKPSRASIIASGAGTATVSNTQCSNVAGACFWGSGMYKTLFTHNTAHNAGDFCFDAEGSADVVFSDNVSELCGNGHYSLGYNVGYGNAAIHNTAIANATGERIFSVNNVTGDPNYIHDLLVKDNHVDCLVGCTLLAFDPTSNSTIEGNEILNGFIGATYEQSGQHLINNNLRYTVSNGGAPGLGMGTGLYGVMGIASGNTIETTTSQTGPCIQQLNLDYNNQEYFVISHNKCYGPWGSSVVLANNGGNAGIFPVWNLVNNFLPSLTYTLTSNYGHNGLLLNYGNCALGAFSAPCDPVIGQLTTPASSAATCIVGQSVDDTNYHYVCVAADTWKRVALASF